MAHTLKLLIIASVAVFSVGCGKTKAPINQVASATFKHRCAPCHGNEGRGDGPAASAMNPKPRDYTDPTWQRGVSDEQIKLVIVRGGTGVGKSALMPAQPDLATKPAELDGLVQVIRAFSSEN
jgi:mono/diheme cytochrome c family protein